MDPDDLDEVALLQRSQMLLSWLVLRLMDGVERIAASSSVGAFESKELRLSLVDLAGELLKHFDREKVGLFPFLEQHPPNNVGVVARLRAYQTEIRESLRDLTTLAAQNECHPLALRIRLEHFDALYADYWLAERSLLAELASALTAEKRAQLQAMLTAR